jgi:hypothetical protein
MQLDKTFEELVGTLRNSKTGPEARSAVLEGERFDIIRGKDFVRWVRANMDTLEKIPLVRGTWIAGSLLLCFVRAAAKTEKKLFYVLNLPPISPSTDTDFLISVHTLLLIYNVQAIINCKTLSFKFQANPLIKQLTISVVFFSAKISCSDVIANLRNLRLAKTV